jgi:hypothetical protein
MKKTILLALVFVFNFGMIHGQDCPEPTKENYKKVTSSAFAKDYEKCPVIIEAEYFGEGYLNGYRKPKKLKDMYFFQCTAIGGEGTKQAFQNEVTGEFFVIDKSIADLVLELKKGDKIELTGTTFTQNYVGTTLNSFFIVTAVKKK